MRRIMIWCWLTEKRLLKKLSYVAVLLILPVLVICLKNGSEEEAGMVSIGLYTPAEKGTLPDQLIERFLNDESILRFYRYESESEAVAALAGSKVDAVWILPENLEEQLEKIAKRRAIRPIVKVLEREDDVALTFTREVLCSKVFPEYVYASYRENLERRLGENTPSEEVLKQYYDASRWNGSLFQAQYLDGTEGKGESYFLAPIRGLLAIWLVLAGFAAILFQKMDESQGVYDGIPARKRLLYSFAMQAVVLFNGGVIYLIALKLLGVFTSFFWEILLLILLLISTAAFCNMVGLLFKRIEAIGIMIPIVTLMMVAFCPIFINIRRFWMVQSLMPPYLYLKALHGDGYLKYMIAYALGGLLLCFTINRIKYRR
ncbi:MAG: ABC transporter permease [Acetatifactor sp.]|nr:ABC transporter permease [Acetatifactor sp.]